MEIIKKTQKNRWFQIDPLTIENDSAEITGSDVSHIKNVLRMTPGDTITLFDGMGAIYAAEIETVEHDRVKLHILGSDKSPQPKTKITLAQAFLKDKKMDLLARQLTELGVFCIKPFMAERSIPNPDAKRLKKRRERWKKISEESLKQCKSLHLPEINAPISFQELITDSDEYDLKIIFWENESQPLEASLKSMPQQPKHILLILGPEGGFSSKEIKSAINHGFFSASLGPRILKAETASVTALSIIQFFFGDI